MYPTLLSLLAGLRRSLLLVMACLGFAATSQAQLILFRFDNSDFANSGSLANATFSGPTTGAGIVATSFSTGVGNAAPSWIVQNQSSAGGPGTLGDSITANDYFEFSITPTLGYALNLTSFSVDLRGAVQGSSTAWTAVGVRYDPENDTTFTTILNQSGVPGTSADPLLNVSTTLTNTNVTNTVVFRIYAYGGGRGVYDNIRVDGTVIAVPEPSALAALLAGTFGMLTLRRRR